jgi:hypothetical protein
VFLWKSPDKNAWIFSNLEKLDVNERARENLTNLMQVTCSDPMYDCFERNHYAYPTTLDIKK